MKRLLLKILGAVLVLLILIQLIPPVKTLKDNPFVINPGDRPLIIAHGGAKLLYPENTMIAFDGSAKIGVDILEMDILITKDGVLVAHHDETIDRMSDGKGKVSEYTYQELLGFNFGYGFKDLSGQYSYRNSHVEIPTVEEIIQKHQYTPMVIELKNKGELGYRAAEELKALIDKYGIQDSVMVASFHDDVLKHFKRVADNSIKTSTSSKETAKFVIMNLGLVDLFYFGNDSALQIPLKHSGIPLDRKGLIRSAHRRNMAVHYWTINDKEQMRRLINLGADGIITDRPDIMKELLREIGFR